MSSHRRVIGESWGRVARRPSTHGLVVQARLLVVVGRVADRSVAIAIAVYQIEHVTRVVTPEKD